jgi:hypothetical protein
MTSQSFEHSSRAQMRRDSPRCLKGISRRFRTTATRAVPRGTSSPLNRRHGSSSRPLQAEPPQTREIGRSASEGAQSAGGCRPRLAGRRPRPKFRRPILTRPPGQQRTLATSHGRPTHRDAPASPRVVNRARRLPRLNPTFQPTRRTRGRIARPGPMLRRRVAPRSTAPATCALDRAGLHITGRAAQTSTPRKHGRIYAQSLMWCVLTKSRAPLRRSHRTEEVADGRSSPGRSPAAPAVSRQDGGPQIGR